MEIQSDFRDLFALFNAHHVDYMIIGAHALAYYGVPRYTGDIDIFVRPDPGNAAQILSALERFGFGSVGLTIDDFVALDKIVQLGIAPVRVDIVTSITGVSWEEAVASREMGFYGDVPVQFIGKTQFRINKRRTGRQKDLADLEALDEK